MMKQRNTDILAIQETRTNKPEKTRRVNVMQTAATFKKSTKYLSSGQLLLYQKDMVMVRDDHNSTEHVNIYNLMHNEKEKLLKIITIYG